MMAIAPVPLVLPRVMVVKVPGKYASSVSLISRVHTAPPQEVELIPLPIPIVVPLVLG